MKGFHSSFIIPQSSFVFLVLIQDQFVEAVRCRERRLGGDVRPALEIQLQRVTEQDRSAADEDNDRELFPRRAPGVFDETGHVAGPDRQLRLHVQRAAAQERLDARVLAVGPAAVAGLRRTDFLSFGKPLSGLVRGAALDTAEVTVSVSYVF